MKKKKSKELQENEDDLLFYLEYWKEFPSTFRKVAGTGQTHQTFYLLTYRY